MNTFKRAVQVFLLIIVIVVPFVNLTTLEFRADLQTIVMQLLLVLITVTVLLERALDVFLTTWRAERSEELDEHIAALNRQIERQENPPAEEVEKLLEIKKEKQRYRAKTRTIAMWSSLLIGIVLSGLAGVRMLEHLVTKSSLAQLTFFQRFVFTAFDIFLTSGLIAGGSDGIHKVMEMLRQFFETSTQRLKYSQK